MRANPEGLLGDLLSQLYNHTEVRQAVADLCEPGAENQLSQGSLSVVTSEAARIILKRGLSDDMFKLLRKERPGQEVLIDSFEDRIRRMIADSRSTTTIFQSPNPGRDPTRPAYVRAAKPILATLAIFIAIFVIYDLTSTRSAAVDPEILNRTPTQDVANKRLPVHPVTHGEEPPIERTRAAASLGVDLVMLTTMKARTPGLTKDVFDAAQQKVNGALYSLNLSSTVDTEIEKLLADEKMDRLLEVVPVIRAELARRHAPEVLISFDFGYHLSLRTAHCGALLASERAGDPATGSLDPIEMPSFSKDLLAIYGEDIASKVKQWNDAFSAEPTARACEMYMGGAIQVFSALSELASS